MKYKHMIAIVLFLFLTACSQTVSHLTPSGTLPGSPSPQPIAAPAPTPTPAPTPSGLSTPVQGLVHPVPYISEIRLYPDVGVFTREDLVLGPVAITSTREDVIGALGEPDRITNDPFHPLGVVQTYQYHGCRIDFLLTDSAYVLLNCTVTEGALSTPRGIGIGDTVRDTLLAYVDRIELQEENRAIFYRSNAGSKSPAAVPPSGVIFRGDRSSEWILQFTVPVQLNPYAGYTQEQIETLYETMDFYTLRFTTAYGKVTRIDMRLGYYLE